MKTNYRWGFLIDLATLLAAGAAVAVAVFLYRGPLPSVSVVATQEDVVVENWEQYLAEGHWMGVEDPEVVLLEFGDYECPACRSFQPVLEQTLAAYPEELAVVYRHWPLSYHLSAYPAARAAECAAEQGAFEGFHRKLYSSENWLGDAFVRFAELSGVSDLDRFRECAANTEPVERIERDIAAVTELGGRGTPTLIVNGVMLAQIPTQAQLAEIIEVEIRQRTQARQEP